MQFNLTIRLGNDAMQTYKDIRAALAYICRYMREYRGPDERAELHDNAFVRDENGNTVGEWSIEEPAAALPTPDDDDKGRTRIGNTPTCEDCGEPLDHCECEN